MQVMVIVKNNLQKQISVVEAISRTDIAGNKSINGVMIESHLS